jgi:protein phosphatase PTC7
LSADDLEVTAKSIANFAFELAKDPAYMSPFALSAKANNLQYIGGKPDDITVIVSRVSKNK